MKKIQNLTTVKLFAVALVASLLSAGRANAQNAYSGKFTLPYEVRWDQAVLPAGEYRFTLSSGNVLSMILVWSSDRKTSAIVRSAGVSHRNGRAPSALIIETRGNEPTVRLLKLAEAGLVLDFAPERGHGRKAIEGAGATRELPVLVAKK